jgi:hypothetical protein
MPLELKHNAVRLRAFHARASSRCSGTVRSIISALALKKRPKPNYDPRFGRAAASRQTFQKLLGASIWYWRNPRTTMSYNTKRTLPQLVDCAI